MAGETKGKSEGGEVDPSSTGADTKHDLPARRVTQDAGRRAPTQDTIDDLDLPHRFEVRRIIGTGAMGVVVEVYDRNLGREVAVKVLKGDRKNDPVYRVRFRREAEATAGLRHPNIVTVHDVDFARDFIVMELIDGESLQSRLRRGRLPADEVRRLGLALLDALAAAHDANIVHRDVKPANILLDATGAVKLVDFGIALFGDRELTASGVRIGTPAYMAPEQLRGRVADRRADIYAVGATLFEAATGIQLHAPDESTKIAATPVLEATNDPVLASAIERAVAELPDDRFPDARAFADALAAPRSSASTLPSTPLPSVGPREPAHEPIDAAATPTPHRRSRLAVGAVAGLVVAALAVIAVRAREHDGSAVSSHAARESLVIAVLPFEDHTKEPRLDFASSGLPHILASELKSISGLTILGYYDLLDRLQDPAAPRSAWVAVARSLGAGVIVRGELSAQPSGIRLVIETASISGEIIGRVERTMTVDSVPAATRSAAGDVARIVFGRPTPTLDGGKTRQFEVERNLQLGIAAIERQDFAAADGYLAKAELEAPDLAEVYYHRAVLNWWLSRDVTAPARRALAGNLEDARRGFLEGLLVLIDETQPTESIEAFRALAARFAGDRDIEYGLFEALFHGDHPVEAMAVYRRLGAQRPRFRLGLKHALAYYFGHGNVEGIAWAVARFDAGNQEATLWQARALIAQRQYKEAIALLRRHEGGARPMLDIQRELAQVYMLDGQLGLAVDTATRWSAEDVVHTAVDLLGLMKARGLEEAQWNQKALYAGELATVDHRREHGTDLAAVELPDAMPARLQRIVPVGPRRVTEVAVVLVAGALGDRAAIEKGRSSPFPEVLAASDAYLAEWAADWNRAAAGWDRAIAAAGDGNFLIVEWLGAARARRAANDHAAVLAACDEVIRPRRFTWAWGGAVGPCLRWSAEAASALGRAADARTYWTRLLALRSAAPADDVLAGAARAALAASP